MSVLSDLSGSQVDDTPTATSATAQSFSYVKDDNDLTDYALDFMEDELSYYPTIQSYTHEENVALFICVNGLVSACAFYTNTGMLNEYLRNDNASEKQFTSIQEWYNDYYGEATSIDKVLNNIFIGEDLVPLWKVLVDEKESDMIISDDELPNNNVEDFNDRVSQYMTLLMTYTTIVLAFASIFGVILVSAL